MTDLSTSIRTTVREHEGDLVVEAVDVVAEGVVAVTLADPGGAVLPAWTPGAHVDLILAPAPPRALARKYSWGGPPSDARRIRIAVLREPAGRGGSTWVHDRLTVG